MPVRVGCLLPLLLGPVIERGRHCEILLGNPAVSRVPLRPAYVILAPRGRARRGGRPEGDDPRRLGIHAEVEGQLPRTGRQERPQHRPERGASLKFGVEVTDDDDIGEPDEAFAVSDGRSLNESALLERAQVIVADGRIQREDVRQPVRRLLDAVGARRIRKRHVRSSPARTPGGRGLTPPSLAARGAS